MNISNIEAQVRTRTGVSTNQYSQAQFLLDINEVKDNFWSQVCTRMNNDRNWDIWYVNETTLNSEYAMPTVAYDTAGVKLLKGISINYDGETYSNTGLSQYVKAREVNPDTLKYEWNYYVENQSTDDPIYFIADNSYFIAPAFRTAGLTNRIKLTGIRKIPDYTISTTEAEMKLPVDFQSLLIWAIIPLALMAKRVDNNEIVKATNDYEFKLQRALQGLSIRQQGPINMLYPNYVKDEEISL